MARITIILAVIAIGLLLWYKISKAPAEKRKNLIFWSTAGVIIGALGTLGCCVGILFMFIIGAAGAASQGAM